MIKKTKSPTRKVVKKTIRKINEAENLCDLIVEGMQEKKAKEIVTLDLRNLKNSVADFFIVCHADSRPHTDAIARSVEDFVNKKIGEDPFHKEGMGTSEWVLLDYLNVVVHIFQKEKRDYYGIERLWADAEVKQIASNN